MFRDYVASQRDSPVEDRHTHTQAGKESGGQLEKEEQERMGRRYYRQCRRSRTEAREKAK